MSLAFVERSVRMAVGIEPRDASRGGDAPWVELRVERALDAERVRAASRRGKDWSELLPEPLRHPSGRIALLYGDTPSGHVDVRLFDRERRFAPRRLRVPVVPEASADDANLAARTRYVALFPGADYPHSGNATGMRGRVVSGDEPVRWARVEARRGAEVVGRAHGDDRGEFLLLLAAEALPGTELPASGLELEVHVVARAAAPTPDPADRPALDPLWDLPLEIVTGAAPDDPVSTGQQVPAELSATTSRSVTFQLGTVLVGTAPFSPT